MNRSQLILGFKLEYIKDLAEGEFSNVQIAKIPGITCSSSGRSAEIFVAAWKSWLDLQFFLEYFCQENI
jgi:hypothetical protein